MDYESITEEKFMEAELIEPAARQEGEESNNSELKDTRCDWNYVYDEVVWYLTTDGTCALPFLCLIFILVPASVMWFIIGFSRH